jgi:hypothetical protein
MARPQQERNPIMHYLMLATLAMPDGATSLAARRKAYDFLLRDDSFCGEGGRFGSPLCDWFVIGGRWSGLLRKTLLGDPYQAACSQLASQHREALNQLWQRFGGTGEHPHNRDSYGDLGCDDDAMIIDQAIYDHFLAKGAGKSCETFADLDDEPVNETFIGRKWLVVVDYHN